MNKINLIECLILVGILVVLIVTNLSNFNKVGILETVILAVAATLLWLNLREGYRGGDNSKTPRA